MNIFALSKCPDESAEQMINKHITKMPTETCQMLHTNILFMNYVEEYDREPSLAELKEYHQSINSSLMKPAMLNHPRTIWARQSIANFHWLYQHGIALCEEYTYRYGKRHGSHDRILYGMRQRGDNYVFPVKGLTPVSIAMADEYRLDRDEYFEQNPNNTEWDFVNDSYKHYYLQGKWEFAEWRMDRRPDWFPTNWYAKQYNKGVRAYNAKQPRYPLILMEE